MVVMVWVPGSKTGLLPSPPRPSIERALSYMASGAEVPPSTALVIRPILMPSSFESFSACSLALAMALLRASSRYLLGSSMPKRTLTLVAPASEKTWVKFWALAMSGVLMVRLALP